MRDARRPSVSSVASTTYQRRSISLSRTVYGLRVHRSSCSGVCSGVVRPHRPEDDAPEAQALGRDCRPVEGRSADRRAPPATACFIHPAVTDLEEDGHDPSHHPAQEGVGRDVDRHERSGPPDPDRMHGPDRLPVRRPEGAEVVPADRRPTRPAPSRRYRVGPAPRAPYARGAGCAARSRRCSGTPGTAPRSEGRTRSGPGAPRGSPRPRGSSASSARPRSVAGEPPG